MTGYLKNKKKGTINSYLSAIVEKEKKKDWRPVN